MKHFFFLMALFSFSTAQSDGQGGWFCNYTATGNEIVTTTAAINSFATAGANSTRPQWCVAYCPDKTSIKATMLLQPADTTRTTHRPRFASDRISTSRYSQLMYKNSKGPIQREITLLDGSNLAQNSTPTNCLDHNVQKTIDSVFENYYGSSVDVFAQQLAIAINKPGWAYLVVELALSGGWFVDNDNGVYDMNFCLDTVEQRKSVEVDVDYLVIAGLVQTDRDSFFS